MCRCIAQNTGPYAKTVCCCPDLISMLFTPSPPCWWNNPGWITEYKTVPLTIGLKKLAMLGFSSQTMIQIIHQNQHKNSLLTKKSRSCHGHPSPPWLEPHRKSMEWTEEESPPVWTLKFEGFCMEKWSHIPCLVFSVVLAMRGSIKYWLKVYE